ncbi:MAG: inorganic diphosphatase [Rhodospirillaceae bacterium]
MQLDKLPAGPAVPDVFYVVVEIPAYGPGIKFELEKRSGALLVDRFLATPMFYPCNYGFIPHTLSLDGDPLDALVLTPVPLIPGIVIACRAVALLDTEDDAGPDAKILSVPLTKLTPDYAHVEEKEDLPPSVLQQIEHFFTHYKDLEPGKWMKVKGWRNAAAARAEITASLGRYDADPSKPNF